jgi:dTDP-4-amino-4,6-dideoxygalactose transaminase
MDKIMDIAHRHNLYVIEDAAQGVMSTYKGKALGAIGDFGAYSFHETKNYTMGEGGTILIQNKRERERENRTFIFNTFNHDIFTMLLNKFFAKNLIFDDEAR